VELSHTGKSPGPASRYAFPVKHPVDHNLLFFGTLPERALAMGAATLAAASRVFLARV
jgi:hypothetical protein